MKNSSKKGINDDLEKNKQQKKVIQKPAITPEGRENQLIALATSLAEEQLRNGTASSQIITHYLKLGTERERIEKEILEEQKTLIRAKTEQLKSAKAVEELYKEALEAMREYSGDGSKNDDE